MYFKIPEHYIVNKFFQYAGYPVYKPSVKGYNGCCPVCREGKSWGKKKRLFYFPKKEMIFCHNCNQSWYPQKWLKEVCGLELSDIKSELGTGGVSKPELNITEISQPSSMQKVLRLPEDSINLFDKSQIQYYKDNKVVRRALQVIKDRRLHTAINRCKALYISLTDYVHKNRLCIPFYDANNNIVYYQTRQITSDGKAKYLSKMYEEKKVFGINNIDPDYPYIFVLEGPIDAMFIKNGIAICGVTMTESQMKQLQQFPMHTLIWCLDNQHLDQTSKERTDELISRGHKVFIWPENIKSKDFNEYCVLNKTNSFDESIIIDSISKPSILNVLSGFKL